MRKQRGNQEGKYLVLPENSVSSQNNPRESTCTETGLRGQKGNIALNMYNHQKLIKWPKKFLSHVVLKLLWGMRWSACHNFKPNDHLFPVWLVKT